MVAGSVWDCKESLLACRAFVQASDNPVKRAEQKKSTFEQDVYTKFVRWSEQEVRSGDDTSSRYLDLQFSVVRQRYTEVRGACIKFAALIKQSIAAELSAGPIDADI